MGMLLSEYQAKREELDRKMEELNSQEAEKKMELSIPADIMISGFDGSMEAALVDPPLATAQIPSVEIGRLAASILSERIRSPGGLFCWTNVKTTPIWGKSIR